MSKLEKVFKDPQNAPAYIIAELSCNHNGDFDEAVRILHAAKDAGADAIKLQTYTADTISRNFKTKPKGTIWEDLDLYALYQKAYTPWEWQKNLRDEAVKIGLEFFSSPFDETAVDFLVDELDVPALKVASFEAVDTKLLQKMAKTGLPIIMSNGMTTFPEMKESIQTLRDAGCEDLIMLQCNSGYPAAFAEANLNTMKVMAEMFNVPVGVSDHTMFADTDNFETPLAHVTPLEAVKMGAKIVEIHLMMDRTEGRAFMEKGEGGFDWPFSREPAELKTMVDMIRAYEAGDEAGYAYHSDVEKKCANDTHGTVNFTPTKKEMASRNVRPSLWIVRDIKKGESFKFAAEAVDKDTGNFDSIRPAGGVEIRFTDVINGKIATRNIPEGTALTWDMVEF
jgi:pseudaminic acid synthase